MSRNLFSLYGFYQYDNTLFDDIKLPAMCDKDTLINVIMDTSGQLQPYHQTPTRLKMSIDFFFSRMYSNYDRMFRALELEYSAVENYDRYEDINETPNITRTTRSTSNSNSTAQNNVSAYNSNTFEPSGLSTGNGSSSGSAEDRESGNRHTTSHIHGNIGVTTAMQMINEELKLRQYDIYKQIALQFEHEILMQVY